MGETVYLNQKCQYTCTNGQIVSVIIEVSRNERIGSMDQAKEIMVSEAVRLLDSDALC